MKSKIIKWFVVFTYLLMILVNFLANYIPINNITAGEVSDSYSNLFAPAGITFSIWGVIYLLLGLYVLYQLSLFHEDKKKDNLFEKIGIYFIISSIANFAWIFSWHYRVIWLSLLFIILMLFCLIKIAGILSKEKFSKKEYFFIHLPFSIYFGWITVAVIANVTVFLVSINWSGFGISEEIWTVLVILVGTIIGILRMFKDKDVAYGLVFIWAYSGILIKHLSFFNKQYTFVIYTAGICIFLFLIGIGVLLKRKSKN